MLPYEVLARKRGGSRLSADEIRAVVDGASRGTWSDAQLAAFLMAVAIRGLDGGETRALTRSMLESGERWRLAEEVPLLADKHSTGGVGDGVSLVLAPLLAHCGLPVAMLTGRGLGHTGGTADKLEGIPGLRLDLGRREMVEVLRRQAMAIGLPTERIAPADRKLYALRDQTATVDSLPLIVASILSKKLATGPAALVFDVKTGSGAFMESAEDARALAEGLVETAAGLELPTAAWITDMNQPLGEWAGHHAEVLEALRILGGDGGDSPLAHIACALGAEVASLLGEDLSRERLAATLASGGARERFLRWAEAQGAEPSWTARPELPLAPVEAVVEAGRSGSLAAVETRRLGLALVAAGGGRPRPEAAVDHGVALRIRARIGQRVEAGQELVRLYLRREDPELVRRIGSCFRIAEGPVPPPPLIRERIG